MNRLLIAMVLCVAATACGPRFHAMTTPPPGREATLTEQQKFWGGFKYDVRLTEGTVLAVGCDCVSLAISADDPRVATVMQAHATNKNPMTQREARVTSFVVVGVRPGKTVIRVKASNGTKVIPVVVEPAVVTRAAQRQNAAPAERVHAMHP